MALCFLRGFPGANQPTRTVDFELSPNRCSRTQSYRLKKLNAVRLTYRKLGGSGLLSHGTGGRPRGAYWAVQPWQFVVPSNSRIRQVLVLR